MGDNETQENKSEHYIAVLSDLRAQRAELDTTIAALERRMGGSSATPASGVGSAAPARPAGDGQGAIRPDEFFGMNILDATENYLKIMKKPQSLGSISSALDRGGLIHQSKNFGATVFTTLRRAEDRADRVVRFQKQWALTEWYPNRPRSVKEDRPKRGKAKKSAKRETPKPKLKVAGSDEPKPTEEAVARYGAPAGGF